MQSLHVYKHLLLNKAVSANFVVFVEQLEEAKRGDWSDKLLENSLK